MLFNFLKKNREPDMKKYLVVGIGNIGDQYENTRHNLGFQVLDYYAKINDLSFSSARYGFIAQRQFKGRTILLLKPSTFVNLSGNAVNYWLKKQNIPVENLLVVVDDINLPLGVIRLRLHGSHGGHNGIKHICATLGHCDFARLRFGIGNNFPRGQMVDYVLGEWTEQEKKVLEQKIPIAAQAIDSFIFEGPARTMTKFNSKKQQQ